MSPMTDLMDTLEKRLSPMVDSGAAAPTGFHKRAVSRDERSSGGRRQRLIDGRRRRLGDGYAGHVRFVDELRFVRQLRSGGFLVIREPGVNLGRGLRIRQKVL